MSDLFRSRCSKDIFETVTTHFEENSMKELESIDVSSLANAFSRVALMHKVCWAKISQRLRTDASSALLPPAAATMALNAFAVVKQCDAELFEIVVESSVRLGISFSVKKRTMALNHAVMFLVRWRPCIADFTLTQSALLLDAVARCSSVTRSCKPGARMKTPSSI